MVWLNLSAIPVGRRGYFPRSNDFYLSSLPVEEGGRESAPCGSTLHYNQGSENDGDVATAHHRKADATTTPAEVAVSLVMAASAASSESVDHTIFTCI